MIFQTYKHLLIIAAGSIALLILSFFLGRNSVLSPLISPLREGGYQYIKPVLLCNPNIDQKSQENVSLSEKLHEYITSAPEKGVSVFYLDLNNYAWAGVNINESFSPASMLKVPTLVAILRYAEAHPEVLNKTIYYDGSFDDNKAEYFKPQQFIQPGHSYTVDELLSYMISYSDNNAARLLDSQAVDPHELTNIYINLGIKLPENLGDIMSPETYSLFLRLLYNSTYLSRQMSEKAIGLLLNPDFPQGIESGVPASVKVANKFGERQVFKPDGTLIERELHDCGIVYTSNPYVLCIMTRGSDFERLKSETGDISRIVYQTAGNH